MHRRKFLLTGGTIAASTAAGLTLLTHPADAQLTMGTLDVQGASKTIGNPPSKVTLSVSGRYELTGSTPDQSRVVLQVEHNSVSRDLDEQINLNQIMSGDYSLSADLLAHPEVEASALVPSTVGKTSENTFTIRVILLAVTGGSIQQETYLEDTATLSLTRDGLELTLSGTGSIQVA